MSALPVRESTLKTKRRKRKGEKEKEKKKRKKKKKKKKEGEQEYVLLNTTLINTLREITLPLFLLLNYPEDFKTNDIIGKGGSGTVYRGEILNPKVKERCKLDQVAIKMIEGFSLFFFFFFSLSLSFLFSLFFSFLFSFFFSFFSFFSLSLFSLSLFFLFLFFLFFLFKINLYKRSTQLEPRRRKKTIQ